jgi:hypothetical protein
VKFSELYEVNRREDDDWFDPLLTQDTRLYVDPFRIYVDHDPQWIEAHDHLLKFFGMVLSYVKEADGNTALPAWTKAGSLMLFPEPAEFCLGMSANSTRGSGSGRGLQEDMLIAARTALTLGIDKLDHIETLVLLSGGIGFDRISDMTCNVLKSYFIHYTQEVCKQHNIATQPIRVRHSEWDETHGRWIDGSHELPDNPYGPGSVLLAPERFLRQIPTADPDDFWHFAWDDECAQLRADFNYDLAKNVKPHVKARLARQNPDLVARYLRALEQNPKPAYDLWRDPQSVTRWYQDGRTLAEQNPLAFLPQRQEEFPQFVRAVIESYSHGLDESDAWRLLWDGNRPRSEKHVQALFRSTVLHYCRANQVVLSGESNAGRGPVDFKFVGGWHAQALVEIKLTNNSHFWDGLHEQTIQYLKSEEVQVAHFVAVGFRDMDFETKRTQRVHAAAQRVSKKTGKDVRVVFVDARQKPSASKLSRSAT